MAEAVSGLTGSLQGTVTGLGNKGMQWLDSIFPPESRAKAMNAITKFSSEKPQLAVRVPHSHFYLLFSHSLRYSPPYDPVTIHH